MGGQIYNKQEITQPGASSFRVTDLANNQHDYVGQMRQEAEQEKQEAFNMYSSGMKLSASQNMADLYTKYENDPTGLSNELQSLNEKMSAEIPDKKMLINFKSDFMVESQSYLNRARSNKKRIDLQNLKDQNEQTILDRSKLFSNAFYNMLTPDGTPDDVVNFERSRNTIDNILSARNPDGTLMYSPLQQDKIRSSLRKVQVDSVKSYFNSLPEFEKKNFSKSLADGNALVQFAYWDEDDKENRSKLIPAKLSDFMDASDVREVKQYAKDYNAKLKELNYLAPEEAQKIAIENMVALEDIKTTGKDLFPETNKEKEESGNDFVKKGVSISQVLEFRNKIKDYRINGVIDDKEYQKAIATTVQPLMKLAEEYNYDEWGRNKNLGVVYENIIENFDNDKTISNLSTGEKAYLLNQAYDMMLEQDINPNDTRKWGSDERLSEIAKTVRNNYLQEKNPKLLTQDIDSVILGSNLYSYKTGKGAKNVVGTKGRIFKTPDGKIYKVYFDSDNRPINRILIRG